MKSKNLQKLYLVSQIGIFILGNEFTRNRFDRKL